MPSFCDDTFHSQLCVMENGEGDCFNDESVAYVAVPMIAVDSAVN